MCVCAELENPRAGIKLMDVFYHDLITYVTRSNFVVLLFGFCYLCFDVFSHFFVCFSSEMCMCCVPDPVARRQVRKTERRI